MGIALGVRSLRREGCGAGSTHLPHLRGDAPDRGEPLLGDRAHAARLRRQQSRDIETLRLMLERGRAPHEEDIAANRAWERTARR
jgi:hypothetical protein